MILYCWFQFGCLWRLLKLWLAAELPKLVLRQKVQADKKGLLLASAMVTRGWKSIYRQAQFLIRVINIWQGSREGRILARATMHVFLPLAILPLRFDVATNR